MTETSSDALSLMPHGELVQKMARDLYFGNGKPALTVRMALQEENMEQVQMHIADIKDNQRRFGFLVMGTLISSIGGLIGIIVVILTVHK